MQGAQLYKEKGGKLEKFVRKVGMKSCLDEERELLAREHRNGCEPEQDEGFRMLRVPLVQFAWETERELG